MITVTKLRCKPRHFQKFTGVTVAEFDQIYAQVEPAYEAALQLQRNSPQRQPGAGRPFTLGLPERLLMTLMYLRLYLGQQLLAYLFDLHQSNISREINHRILPILQQILPTPIQDAPLRHLAHDPQEKEQRKFSNHKHRRLNTLQELLQAHPEFEEVLIDATEQSIPQPQEKQQRKLVYSGKQQDHTVKTQIVGTRQRILHVFGGLPGSLSDITLLGASGVIPQVPPDRKIRIDKGYEGTERRYPKQRVEQPIKGKRNHRVTLLGRVYNYMLSTSRIYVEHHFSRLQTFGILREVYHGRFEDHEDIFCIISGLLNFRATGCFELG